MLPPFFVIGNPRSGTTLLRLMLASHPSLLVAPECGFAVWLAEKYSTLDIRDPKVVTLYANDVYTAKKFDTWGIGLNELTIFLLTANAGSYAELVSAVYASYGAHINKKYTRWGDKNNFYLNYIPKLAELYPSAQFIHIVRDGRDVACSYRELSRQTFNSRYAPNLPVDIEVIAREWKENIKKVQESLFSFPASQGTEVKFDDLVINSESTLRRLCEFLKIDFSFAMLSYHQKNFKEHLEPSETMEWKQKTFQPPQACRIGRYKQDLTLEEIQCFEYIAQDQLTDYGFF